MTILKDNYVINKFETDSNMNKVPYHKNKNRKNSSRMLKYCGLVVMLILPVTSIILTVKIASLSLCDPDGVGYKSPTLFNSEDGETPLIFCLPCLALSIFICVAAYRNFLNLLRSKK